MKMLKKIPKFKNELEENIFWQKKNSLDYIEWDLAKNSEFPNLKRSTKTISIKLPESLLNHIKILANKEDVPYQSLIKILLSQGVNFFRKSIH